MEIKQLLKVESSNNQVVASPTFIDAYQTSIGAQEIKNANDIKMLNNIVSSFTIDGHYTNPDANAQPNHPNSIPVVQPENALEEKWMNDNGGKVWKSNGFIWEELATTQTTSLKVALSDPANESISGTAQTQSVSNIENKQDHTLIRNEFTTADAALQTAIDLKVNKTDYEVDKAANEQAHQLLQNNINTVDSTSKQRDAILTTTLQAKVDTTTYNTGQAAQDVNIQNNAQAIDILEANQIKTIANLFFADTTIGTTPVPITNIKTYLTFGSQYITNSSGVITLEGGSQTIKIDNIGTTDLKVSFNHSFTLNHLTVADVGITTYVDRNTLSDFTGTTTNIYTSPIQTLTGNVGVNETFTPSPVSFIIPPATTYFLRIAHLESGAPTDANFINAHVEFNAGRQGIGFATINDSNVINTNTLSFTAANQKIINTTFDNAIVSQQSQITTNNNAAVHKTGDETIDGIKTFNSNIALGATANLTGTNPLGPYVHPHATHVDIAENSTATPFKVRAGVVESGNRVIKTATAINSDEAINKGQLDNGLATKANDSEVVHLAGTETITGEKTFADDTMINKGVGVVFTDPTTTNFNVSLYKNATIGNFQIEAFQPSTGKLSAINLHETTGKITLTGETATITEASQITTKQYVDDKANTGAYTEKRLLVGSDNANTILTTYGAGCYGSTQFVPNIPPSGGDGVLVQYSTTWASPQMYIGSNGKLWVRANQTAVWVEK